MKQLVTVVIPFYNPGNFIIKAIESVCNQSFKEWKLLLIDDASTDNSVSMITPFLQDQRITLIQNPKNIGQSKSMNVGLEQCDTPYLVQLDADDWFDKNALEILFHEAEKQPKKIAVVSSNMRQVFEDEAGNVVNTIIRKGRSYNNKYKFLLANTSLWPRFYRTSALKKIGGWPVDVPLKGRYMEDKLILYRLIEKYHFHYIDVTVWNYRIHQTNQTHDLKTYRKITKWAVYDALRRWGNQYQPVFELKDGWLLVIRLIPKRK